MDFVNAIVGFARHHRSVVAPVKALLRFAGVDLADLVKYLAVANKTLFFPKFDHVRQASRVNLGGGHFYKSGWTVLDHKIQCYEKIVPGTIDVDFNLASHEPFPFAEGQLDCIYSSHCIEHIPFEYCQNIFNEIHRCLKKGGVARIMVPNFDAGYEALGRRDNAFFDNWVRGGNMETTFVAMFASEYWSHRLKPEEIREAFARSGKEEFAAWVCRPTPEEYQRRMGMHCTWWNYERMEEVARAAGFSMVRQAVAHDSGHPEMKGSGTGWRFDSYQPDASLFLEAIKL